MLCRLFTKIAKISSKKRNSNGTIRGKSRAMLAIIRTESKPIMKNGIMS
jgi:hypothetical protein